MEANCLSTFPGKQSKEKIKEAFDKAIDAGTRAHVTQDAALANELAGEFFIREDGIFWSTHYLTKPHELYRKKLIRDCEGFVYRTE
jgi:predicted lactoylglutathione lyase